jgi:signal transduction histidine kinase
VPDGGAGSASNPNSFDLSEFASRQRVAKGRERASHAGNARWLLDRAVDRARGGFTRADDASSTDAELASWLATLADLAAEVLQGNTPQIPQSVLPEHQRVATALRRGIHATIDSVAERIDGQVAVRVLRAVEQVDGIIERSLATRADQSAIAPGALDLVVDMAHDMRSPLTSILFLVEALRKAQSGPVNSVQERQLGLVYSAAFALSALSNDVVELAYDGDRLLDEAPVPFSVLEVFQSVRDIVHPIGEEKDLTVTIVPPDASGRLGHPAGLARVLLNLTINALKFTDTGGVEISSRAVGRTHLEFSVRDTGRGVPPAVICSLFDTFRPAAARGRRGRRFSNAGLGLSICRRLVARMGGELNVETQEGRGTRFYFQLELPTVSRI